MERKVSGMKRMSLERAVEELGLLKSALANETEEESAKADGGNVDSVRAIERVLEEVLRPKPKALKAAASVAQEASMKDVKAFYTTTGLLAQSLRQNVRTALIMGGVPDTDENVQYVARKMVDSDGASLLDSVEFLKSAARRIVKR